MPLYLSDNFTLTEMCQTDTGLDNIAGTDSSQKLYYLCQFILQPIRDKFGRTVISSGYRSPEVNDAVKGSLSSQHIRGEAADIVPVNAPLYDVYAWISSNLNYGQSILYSRSNFIHISMPRLLKDNKENLICENGIYKNWEGI